jgi:hypothetical protein
MSPRRAFWLAALAGAAAAAATAGAACLDLTPYEAPSAEGGHPMPDVVVGETGPMPDASVSDAAVDGDASAPEVVVPPTCLGCLNWADDAAPPGCAAQLAVCMTNPKCAATYACTVANGCFQQPSFRQIVNCGIPCAEEAGIVTGNDPAVQLIYNIAVCAACNCSTVCAIADSGVSCGD